MNKKNINISNISRNKIDAIKDFASKMDYEINEYNYTYARNWPCDKGKYGRPCYCIELIGTCDSEGDPYSWSWFVDTGTEVV